MLQLKGVNPDQETTVMYFGQRRQAAIHFAAHSGSVDVVGLLLKHTREWGEDWSPLHAAATREDKSREMVLRALLQSGRFDANTIASVMTGDHVDTDVASYLLPWLRHSYNERTTDHNAVLRAVFALTGSLEPGISLLEKVLADPKTDVNQEIPNSRGQTALHIAVQRGSAEAARMLLTRPDLCVNSRESVWQSTPLHTAMLSYMPNEDVLRALLEDDRTDLEARNGQGETPVDLARNGGWASVMGAMFSAPFSFGGNLESTAGLIEAAIERRNAAASLKEEKKPN